MVVFIFASATFTAVSSFAFYFVAKRLKLCEKFLILSIAVLNAVFCALFPLLFAAISGKKGRAVPSLEIWKVFVILFFITAIYVFLLVWRVVLRSPGVRLNVALPAAEPVLIADNVDIIKDSVDTSQNVDKMGISIMPDHGIRSNELEDVINKAFDSLNGGNLEEAAGYFYDAILRRPPFFLEIQIAIQLSMVYSELGSADLSLDILGGYIEKYGYILSDGDMAALKAGVSIIESMIAGIGGDGNEEN